MIKTTAFTYQLQFKYPFKIAHGVRTTTPIVIVKLNYQNLIAYGEASLPPYLSETQDSVLLFIKKAQSFLSSLTNFDVINDILEELDSIQKNNTAAKASIDIALHDLIGKIKKQSVWEMIGADKYNTPFTTHTIGIDTEDMIFKKIKEAKEFKTLKIKLDGKNDKQIISTIRNMTMQPLAVDVNQGWKNYEDAMHMIEWLQHKNVVLIEQPLRKEKLDDSFKLFENSPLPIYADESIQRINDIENIKDCFHGFNIKLMKCTGINEAKKMISLARRLNKKVLIGCMSETSCAVSAAAHLSPLADYADLDGPLLINNDLFDGIKYNEGKICLNNESGIGVELKRGIELT